MTVELLRIPHGKTPGHDLVLTGDPAAGFRLATVMREHGIESVLHVVHLRASEIVPLAHALIDALASAR